MEPRPERFGRNLSCQLQYSLESSSVSLCLSRIRGGSTWKIRLVMPGRSTWRELRIRNKEPRPRSWSPKKRLEGGRERGKG